MAVPSEALRLQERVDQINEQADRRQPGDDIVHREFSLQLVAGFGEGPEDEQDQAADSDIEQIKHRIYSISVKITS